MQTEEYASVDVDRLRGRFEEIAAAFPQSHRTNESQTEDDFIWPILTALGWNESLRQQNLTVTGRDDVPDGLLFEDSAAKAAANTEPEQWKRYAHGLVAVESKRWNRPLDRASGRGDEALAPSTQMLRYLRRIDDLTHGRLRWGVLTNGIKWRLYWAGARSVSEEFLEIDLGRVLGLGGEGADLFATPADRDHWLRVFALMFGRVSFPRGVDGNSFHQRALLQAAFYEERVADSLSGLVFEKVFPSLASAIAGAAPEAPLETVREASLVLLYRLLFLLYAEDRALLPVNNDRYDDYALRPLRNDVARRISDGDAFSTSAARIWGHVSDLSRIVDGGDTSVGIPPYNGGLFAQDAAGGLLERVRISDAVMAPALDALSHERRDGEARYINYRDLSVQQLGSIYERLLEFEIVQEDGALAVRPNLFARKNSGSYYTPEELVRLILDETLEPLITDRLATFRTALEKRDSKDAEDYQRRLLRDADPAQAILGLRVCDPAMGSGHFLVSLVDTLSVQVLDAMAEAAVLAADLDYISPLADEIGRIRDTILRNARDKGWAIEEEQLDDRHIVRRMVLKRCVYGVDKNPMAVELAKVALWLHTFTVGAPLSFIDHHLRAGDSLFGLWVRDAIDKAAQGGELLWNEALRNAQRSAEAMKTIEALTDVEIAEAHRSAAMYEDVELMTGELDGFVSFIHAIDWLKLNRDGKALVRLWLDGRFGDPIPIARRRKPPEAGKARPDEVEAFTEIWERARTLIAEERFLNWQIAFPGVWHNWSSKGREGGFDAVVGNPPWDRIKLQQVEWFAARRPEIALAQRASDRARMIAALKAADDPLYADFEKADARAADTARMARKSGHYPMLSGGDTNLNSLFIERAHALVKPGGMVGMLVPSGLASDQSSAAFFRKVTGARQVRYVIDFFNKRYDGSLFFPDVYYRFKFCAYVAGGEQRTFDSACYGFFIRDLTEVANADRVFPIGRDEIDLINPNSGTAPIFRSRRDKEVTSGIYARLPVLVNRTGAENVAAWPVRYVRMLDMANDSGLFRTRNELESNEGAWSVGGSVFDSAAGRWVPLYEGKMVQAFDHRASDIVLAESNIFRSGQGMDLTHEDHRDPARLPHPRYWVEADRTGWDASTDWCLAIKDITSVTNTRTVIAAIIPRYGAGHTLPVLFPEIDATGYAEFAPLVLANLNSMVLDYVARQKVHGNHLAWYLLEQLPVVPPDGYARMFGARSAAEIVREAVLELSYTSNDMAPFARDMGHVDSNGEVLPPFVWDEERRANLRAKLDAIYFILYGLWDPADPAKSRDNISYIFSTFTIVEREETAKWGRYRSRDLCLGWINALVAGQPDADVQG